MAAVETGRTPLVRLLLEKKVCKIENKRQYQPIFVILIKQDNVEILSLFLSQGWKPNDAGSYLLPFAVESASFEVVTFLVRHGADKHKAPALRGDLWPIEQAILVGDFEVVKFLLSGGDGLSFVEARALLRAVSLKPSFYLFQTVIEAVSNSLSVPFANVIQLEKALLSARLVILANEISMQCLQWLTDHQIPLKTLSFALEGDENIWKEHLGLVSHDNYPRLTLDVSVDVLEALLDSSVLPGDGILKLCASSCAADSQRNVRLLMLEREALGSPITEQHLLSLFYTVAKCIHGHNQDLCAQQYQNLLRFLAQRTHIVDKWLNHVVLESRMWSIKSLWLTIRSRINWPLAIDLGVQAAEKLIEMGASVNSWIDDYCPRINDYYYGSKVTPLQAAVALGNRRIVLFLLQHGADPELCDEGFLGHYYTALQAAAGQGYFQITLDLLQGGADVNAPASRHRGRTALEAAAENGRLNILRLLIINNHDTERLRQDCKRSARLARYEAHSVIAEVLQKHAQKLAAELGVNGEDEFDTMHIHQLKRYEDPEPRPCRRERCRERTGE